ncbi:MAG: hypothetical protein AAB295_01695 [Chloroflexota bacterium]
MGTRYEDQPTEHWAGPESLDPTPVWKQYALIALLLVVGLVVIVIVSAAALAPYVATPPALVAGDRLVLAASDLPAVGQPAKLVGSPVIDDARSFWLAQPQKGMVLAIRRIYAPQPGGALCTVERLGGTGTEERSYVARCGAQAPTFTGRGQQIDAGFRPLDQYLVSVSGDRVIVNLSRVIEGSQRTAGPVPTGIPQPQGTP